MEAYTVISHNLETNKKAAFAALFICLESETHRLMRYCTVQFSRNERFRRALHWPDR